MKDTITILRELAQEHGIIQCRDAVAHGISRATLHLLAKRGEIDRVGHGFYMVGGSIADDLLAISHISSTMVFSHETALFLNGLSDRTPFFHAVTISNTRHLSPKTRQMVECHYVSPELHGIGRTLRKTMFGHDVPCYDAERTVCDIIRGRKRMDEETFISGIANYAKSKDRNLIRLAEYAKLFGIGDKVKHQLEGLL